MIPVSDLALGETLFTHIDPVDGSQTNLAIGRLVRHVIDADLPTKSVVLTLSDAKNIVMHRGLERHRYDRLTLELCKIPLVFCHWPDKSWLLADGNHRYVRLVLEFQIRWTQAYLLEQDVWQDYVVDGKPSIDPKTLLRSFSGII